MNQKGNLFIIKVLLLIDFEYEDELRIMIIGCGCNRGLSSLLLL